MNNKTPLYLIIYRSVKYVALQILQYNMTPLSLSYTKSQTNFVLCNRDLILDHVNARH